MNKIQLSNYIKTEQIIHNWVQLLGKFGIKYIPNQPDDSHENLGWNSDQNRLETWKTEKGIYMAFSPMNNRFEIHQQENNDLMATVEIHDQSIDDVKTSLIDALKKLNFDTNGIFENMSFRFQGQINPENKTTSADSEAVSLQNTIRSMANNACQEMLEKFNQKSEIRVWPHNFDTGIYCEHGNGLIQFAGYSPADDTASKVPYFYNSFYLNGEKVLPNAYPTLKEGFWETANWGGAILELPPIATANELQKIVSHFLIESTETMLTKNS